jgi:alpha-L-rhamnosidase
MRSIPFHTEPAQTPLISPTAARIRPGSSWKSPIQSLLIFALLLSGAASGLAKTSAIGLQCENLENPSGIDVSQPRLSWRMDSNKRGEKQTAYRILVASTASGLKSDKGDLWDSGKVDSDESIQITYGGKPLSSHQQCFWKVGVWDKDGKLSWSKPAEWSVGLLTPSDWKSEWIGLDGEDKTNWLSGTDWIWFPEGEPEKSAPIGDRYFRRTFALPADREVKHARLLMTGDSECRGFVNGHDIGNRNNYHTVKDSDITSLLEPGKNVIALQGRNRGNEPKAAGVVALVEIEFDRGDPMVITTDEQWKTRDREEGDWNKVDFDDMGWRTAKKLGPVGMDPWGNVQAPESRRLPARWLRKEFAVEKKIKRAVVYFSGLGVSELYLNGSKVNRDVLSPAVAEYSKRVFYVTYDVTSWIHEGANCIGVVLGNGRFYSPRSRIYSNMPSYGFPKLLLHLRIEHTDGSVSEVVSDASWKLTANGPILANNEYDGEEYDARKEMASWSKPGFKDASWQSAQPVTAPPGKVEAQMMEPIRVTQTLKPVKITEPKPGVFIFDMGQNMVGWCRLKVSGPARTQVILRHAETLKPDGTIYIANLRGARVTDKYTLNGKGTEEWEPRFIYHGFRYVEVTGFPGRPTLNSLEGRVVHDDLKAIGEFASSDPLLNQIYRNVVWGTRGNYRSIPTDCPQRDERQGWLGDRAEESKGESFFFDTEAFHEKWLADIADAQKENGSVPDVAPSFWPIYNDDVVWPSTSVILPSHLYEQFGDKTIVARHYDGAKRWIDYMTGFVTNGIIYNDKYGDWCVPPEDPALIHSKDPARQTDKALLATTFFYHDLNLMERYATLLGRKEDAQRFRDLAAQIKTAFNEKFLKRDSGQYDNGTQTSCVLPLAFGLVPDEMRERVFDRLVQKITKETRDHIGTGLVGGQYLMRVLTDNGRADLALRIATQKDYPSWGYMISKGATTIWELWNGNTADPAMNSGNHVMLVGDLAIWMYENLGGIRTDPNAPGFKHLLMKPEPVGNLTSATASHRSPYGLIRSQWRKDEKTFHWKIKVPPNTSATIYIPASSLDDVTEGQTSAVNAAGVMSARYEKGRAILEIASGKYDFVSQAKE